ncbi:MAG: DUF2189 domain-containing protein [Gammaproteobacteria bacterium]|nr:DUF2189 domain-containing protein [Gammaproteobacteria bacterium]
METTHASDDTRSLHLEIRHVGVAAPFAWLAAGWGDLRRNWGTSLGYGALIAALGWTVLVFCAINPYLIAAAITGFLLVGPPMSAGFCEMSRRYADHRPATLDDSLEGFAHHASALLELGVILAIGAVIWFLVSAVMLDEVFGVTTPSVAATLYHGFIDEANRRQILAYVATGGILAVAVFALTVVAVPLIVDRHATAPQAVRASLRVVAANIPAMGVWSALILLLTVIGYAPLLVGLVLTLPLLGHASWHAYRDVIH